MIVHSQYVLLWTFDDQIKLLFSNRVYVRLTPRETKMRTEWAVRQSLLPAKEDKLKNIRNHNIMMVLLQNIMPQKSQPLAGSG